MKTDYEQLPDGRWQRKLMVAGAGHVTLWYMRRNHSFVRLPLDIEAALKIMRNERDSGETFGMLCGHPPGVVQKPVHARTAADWPKFETKARPWLEQAVARSKPPNVAYGAGQTAAPTDKKCL